MDTNGLPDGWTIDEVRRRAQDSTAELLDPRTPVFLEPGESGRKVRLEIDIIVGFTGLFLARCADDGEWYMGSRAPSDESLSCWSSYSTDFGAAIDGL